MNPATDAATLARAHALLNAFAPGSRAFWFYDLDAIAARARRLAKALASLEPRIAYALKANGLPAIARTLREAGMHADAGSLGELELADACGFDAAHRTLSGNGRTPEEAAWAAAHGVVAVSADTPEELDLLEQSAAHARTRLRVALRVNPGIVAGGHRHIATGHSTSKFGMSASQALAAWQGRARWEHLVVEGVHLHVGSQIDSAEPLVATARAALELAAESARRGAPLESVNLGGGFGVDYAGDGDGMDLAPYAEAILALPGARSVRWCFEPGRWLVAKAGTLVAEVLWDKRRDEGTDEHRFVVLAAGMNDLIRPALYGARHRIVALGAPGGALTPADVVGPVCESSDGFATAVPLPPLARGALVAILDAGAYGAAMSSNYNGRGRLAEVVHAKGELRLARAGEVTAVRAALLANRSEERVLGVVAPVGGGGATRR